QPAQHVSRHFTVERALELGHFAFEGLGERYALVHRAFRGGAYDGLFQWFEPDTLVRLDRHDRHTQPFAEAAAVDLDAMPPGHVHHVERDDHRHAELQRLRGEIQIAL